jgi:hypothetical protein
MAKFEYEVTVTRVTTSTGTLTIESRKKLTEEEVLKKARAQGSEAVEDWEETDEDLEFEVTDGECKDE